jgi:hypothetical protein
VTLGSLGLPIDVTLAAASEYGAARGLGDEDARRELESLLLEARQRADASSWRYRRRPVDVTARVAREHGRLVVVSVTVRRYP